MRHPLLPCKAYVGALVLILAACVMSTSAAAQSRRNVNRGITVFTNPNFTGDSATFRDDMPDLRGYGLNDKISSIEITDGEAWEICQDVNYGNRCQVLSGSVSNLRDMGWNDRISSLRRVAAGSVRNRRGGTVYTPRASQARLLFYDKVGFRGSSTMVSGDNPNMSFVGKPRSVEVRGGEWQLCDKSGRCATVSSDVSDLSQLGLKAQLRSATLMDDRYYGNSRTNQTNRPWWRP